MPPTDAAPDAELARLLDDYARDYCVTGDGGDCRPMYASRAALLAYLARAYVRREQADEDEWNARWNAVIEWQDSQVGGDLEREQP